MGRWLGFVGLAIAVLILIGALEQFRFDFEGPLALAESVGTTAFPFWLIGLAGWLLRTRPRSLS